MASVTIHALPPELERRINTESERRRMSKNALVKEILADALGIGNGVREDYVEFLGLWSDEETEAFHLRLAESESIDREEW